MTAFDRIFDLPPTQRLFLYIGTGLFIVFVYAFVFYSPLSQEISNKQRKIHNLKAEHAKLQTLIKNKDRVKAAVGEMEGYFNQLNAQLPEQQESSQELLRRVSQIGQEEGLEVLSSRLKPEQLHDLYTAVPMEMAVRGGYHQIALFFDKVRQLDQIVNIADVTLKNPQLIAGQLRVESAFSAVTYRLVSEEEHEKITKEKAPVRKKEKKRSNVL